MKLPSYSEIQDFFNGSNLDHLPNLNISILRNITLEPITLYLRYMAYKIGHNAKIEFGGYDTIFQETVGGNDNLLNSETDVVLIFTKLDALSWKLSRSFSSLNHTDIETELSTVKTYVHNVLIGIRKQTKAMILWHGFEFYPFSANGILDSQTLDGQPEIIVGLNRYLKSRLNEEQNAYFVDLNLCLARLGAENFYDFRYWHIGRAPFSRTALCEIAGEEFKFIRSLKGKNKKCLVLDCDNVLWGGIIGEDGISGIKLSKTYPGSAYYEFQQEILNLYNRGIIIALCSKNNEEDVREVLKKHPDMLLKEEHITASRINWDDKVKNLKELSEDLNIGLDSMVFMDDSEVEINLVHENLPEIEVMHLPSDKSVDFRNMLLSCGFFDTLTLSEEDKMRGAMYKADVGRKKMKVSETDLYSYYKSLEMELYINLADEFSIPRLAQLTQKTNQFNLTTKRYSELDIQEFSNSKKSDVIYVKLRDKFGDMGIVGMCIIIYQDKTAVIDLFLLSCRVIGRMIEEALLNHALRLARAYGCVEVLGEYYATRKNAQVKDFYIKNGFVEIIEHGSKADKVFKYDISGGIKQMSDCFKTINTNVITNRETPNVR